MRERYVVDTNVLIAASAVDAQSPIAMDATPADPVLREVVWKWLDGFQQASARLVLDGQGRIEEEYARKLGFNDFGRQVVLHKWSVCQVDQVDVSYDTNGHGILDEPLQTVIHDTADRKMVATALGAKNMYGACAIAFAGDTDWHGWEVDLAQAGLELEPLIERWSRAKFIEKQKR